MAAECSLFFFFNQKTAYEMRISDWSSDVCSSDLLRFATTVLAVILALPALAAEAPQFTIRIENHRFVPAELIVPAGQKMKLVIENRDDSAEEFESYELKDRKSTRLNSSH